LITLRFPGLPGPDGHLEWNDEEIPYVGGRKFSDYLASIDLPPEKVAHIIVDGAIMRPGDVVHVLLPETTLERFWRELWRKHPPVEEIAAFDGFIPRDGTVIWVLPDVEGRNTALILGVVGAVVAWYLLPASAGLLATAQGVMTGYAIGSTIGALVSPHQRPVKGPDGQTSYVWSGSQNDDRAGIPRPIATGERLIAGDRISSFRRRPTVIPPRTASSPSYDGTTLFALSETLHVLVLVAGHVTEGPVGVTNPKLPIDVLTNQADVRLNGQHHSNFPGTEIHWRTGRPGQPALCHHNARAGTITVTAGSGTVTGVGTLFLSSASPNAVNKLGVGHTIQANGEYHVITSIVSDTVLTTDPWKQGASGVRYTLSLEQPIIPGFNVIAQTYPLSIDLTDLAPTPYLYTTVRTDCDAFEVLMNLSGLSSTQDNGSFGPNATRYKCEYRRHGTSDPWTNIDYDGQREIKGANRGAIFETRRVEHLVPAQYDIRLTWLSAQSHDVAKDQWHIALTGITEEKQIANTPGFDGTYPGDSLYAINSVASAQFSGGTPNSDVMWRGYIPQVYDGSAWKDAAFGALRQKGAGTITTTPGSGTVTGVGTRFLADLKVNDTILAGGETHIISAIASDTALTTSNWTAGLSGVAYSFETFAPPGRNPYWISAALARDTQVGCGVDLPAAGLVATAWKSAADYAAEAETVVPNPGVPYIEPRFQFDCYFNQQVNSLDLLQSVVTTASGTLLFHGDALSVGVDRPGDPKQAFNVGNMVKGSFNQQFKSGRGQLNTYDTSFDDGKADYQTEVVTVSIRDTTSPPNNTRAGGTAVFCTEDDLQALGLPVLRQSLSLVGVTRRTQAVRSTRLRLRQNFALSQYGNFSAWIDAITAQTYDIVGIQHDLPQWGYGGTVMPGSTSNMILFDRSVPFVAGTPYSVRVRYASGDAGGHEILEQRDVADATAPADGSEYFGFFVTVPFSKIPQEGDLWFYGPVGKELLPARIVQIGRDGSEFRPISFVEQNNSLYDTSGPIDIPSYSLLPNFGAGPAPITSLTASTEIITQQDGSKITNVLLEWAAPQPLPQFGFYGGAAIDYGYDGVTYQRLASVDGNPHYVWPNAPHGQTLYFRVTPYSTAGRYNLSGSAFASVYVRWYGSPAPAVTGLAATAEGDAFVWRWTDPGREFQIEVRDVDNYWLDNVTHPPLYRGRATEYKINGPAVRTKTLYVRAFDAFLNVSASSASASVTKSAPVAPSVNPATITRADDWIKVPVGAATDPEVRAIYMWASQTDDFVPDDSTRVSMVVAPSGGEFVFKTRTTGLWNFRFACADAISERLHDFQYSGEIESSTIVPQNPSAVTLTPNPTPSRRRAMSAPSAGSTQAVPLKVFHLFVNWTFVDAVNASWALVGFEVIVYPSGGDPSNPYWSRVVEDVGRRSVGIPDLQMDAANTYVAAVRALYIGGITSSIATSTGLLLDPTTFEAPHQTSDDRPITPYVESFDLPTLPTGFTKASTDSVAIISSALVVTAGDHTSSWVQWDVKVWANAYLDSTTLSHPTFSVVFAVTGGTSSPSPSVVVTHDNGFSGPLSQTVPLIQTAGLHTYRVDFPSTSPLVMGGGGATSTIKIDASNVLLVNGTQWQLAYIAIAWDDVDLKNDGRFDRVSHARDQFDRDPSGHGFFGIAPLRLANDLGDIKIIDSNGSITLYSGGNTDPGYKRGRQILMSHVASGSRLYFSDATLNPAIPQPAGVNKIRLLVNPVSHSTFETQAAAADYPIRRYTEVTEITQSDFRINDFIIKNGAANVGRVVAGSYGGWPQSVAKKSAMTVGAFAGGLAANSNAAWLEFNVAGTFSLPLGGSVVYRNVLWIAIQMPLLKKPNGSFYYATMQFYEAHGTEATGTNPMTLDNTYFNSASGPYPVKTMTDGQLWRIPIVIAPFNTVPYSFLTYYTSVSSETGAGSSAYPTSVWLDEVDYFYVNSAAAPFPTVVQLSPQDLNLTHLEEE